MKLKLKIRKLFKTYNSKEVHRWQKMFTKSLRPRIYIYSILAAIVNVLGNMLWGFYESSIVFSIYMLICFGVYVVNTTKTTAKYDQWIYEIASVVTTMACMWLNTDSFLNLMWVILAPAIAVMYCKAKHFMIVSGILFAYFEIGSLTEILSYPSQQVQLMLPWFILFECVMVVIIYGSVVGEIFSRWNKEKDHMGLSKTEREIMTAMTSQTILSISNAVDARDEYTRMHSARVADYSVRLAKLLGWDERDLNQLYEIALLHDIGKIGVNDSILNKRTHLSDEEYESIKQHTIIGERILKDLTLLPNASVGALSHHERYDGKGYPYGLKGKQIPIEARIIGIVDAFDAMNSSRIYRGKMTSSYILEEIRNGRGTQFDPEITDVFLPVAEEILKKGTLD